MNIHVIREINALTGKTISELRTLYERLFSEEPKHNATKNQLIPKIAYHLQEVTLGTLSPDIRYRLEKIADGANPVKVRPHSDLKPGTKIYREWNGVEYQVEVTQTGFEYQGQPFNSLSAIATKITGTRRNGPKFFGLRSKHAC